MLHSGEYYLFESDSEDEEELFSEEQKPPRQSAFQVSHKIILVTSDTHIYACLRTRTHTHTHIHCEMMS